MLFGVPIENQISNTETIRWIHKIDDPEREANRIELYKAKRRERYDQRLKQESVKY